MQRGQTLRWGEDGVPGGNGADEPDPATAEWVILTPLRVATVDAANASHARKTTHILTRWCDSAPDPRGRQFQGKAGQGRMVWWICTIKGEVGKCEKWDKLKLHNNNKKRQALSQLGAGQYLSEHKCLFLVKFQQTDWQRERSCSQVYKGNSRSDVSQ